MRVQCWTLQRPKTSHRARRFLFFAPMGAEGCPSLQALPQDAGLVEPLGKGPNIAPLSSQAQASVEEGGRPISLFSFWHSRCYSSFEKVGR